MLYESRGMYKIMAELTRKEHLEIIITTSINEFISKYVYDYLKKSKLTDYAINKFNIEEDDIEIYEYIARDIVVEALMRYQRNLVNIISIYNISSTGTIVEQINELKESLRNDENLFECLKYLRLNVFSLDRDFEKVVIEKIETEIKEHLMDIKDVESGKVIKTISQKNIELEKEKEKEIKKYEEISRINSSYWSDYEDSIREVRGLDKDCPIF